jgi:probable F420-dependent oxidoreductase
VNVQAQTTIRWNLNVPDALAGDWSHWLGPGALEEFGALVEAAGFDAVSVSDHPFPATEWLAHGGHHTLDPFVALSFLAAGTQRLRLFSNVLVLPYRDPVITAKSIASLDVLSGGRLIIGTAIGYLKEEFEAVGADFGQRAATFERTITEMKEAWATDGTGAGVAGHHVSPPPLQRPHPPIWIGGNSAAARRRAVALGDGWMPFGQDAAMAAVTGTPPLETAAQLAEQVRRLDEERVTAGRPDPLDVCFGVPRRGALHSKTASTDEMDEEVSGYAEAGSTWLTVLSRAKVRDDLRRELDRWAPLIDRHRSGVSVG